MPKLNAESIRRKREKLEAELEALRSAEKSAADERNAIAGRALLDHALKDQAFAEQLVRILDRALTKRRERTLFGLSTRGGARPRTRPKRLAAEAVPNVPPPAAGSA